MPCAWAGGQGGQGNRLPSTTIGGGKFYMFKDILKFNQEVYLPGEVVDGEEEEGEVGGHQPEHRTVEVEQLPGEPWIRPELRLHFSACQLS